MNASTLLTGFGPFGGIVSNPSQRLLEHFAQVGAPGHDLMTLLLPVAYSNVPSLISAALEGGGKEGRPFENVVMLGVADRSMHWRVECVGRNRDGDAPDIEGQQRAERPIVEDAPETLLCTWPDAPLVKALMQAGLPAQRSEDAGGYLCNHLLFRMLHHLTRSGSKVRAGFLHVPADEATFAPGDPRTSSFTFVQQVAAVNTVLQELR